MPSSAVASASQVEPARSSARFSTRAMLTILALGALWFICCRHLSSEWTYNEQYNYGWFVPFFALYLFWLRWEDRPAAAVSYPDTGARRRQTLIALTIALPCLLSLLPVRLIEVANPDWRLLSWAHSLAAVALTLTVIWWAGGKPWLRHFAFPVVFVLIAVPWMTGIEQPIIQGLMPTIATIATETLSLFGIPAEVQGNLIRINDGVVGVNEACSGVRSLQTSLMIGLLFGELTRLGWMRRVALIIAAIGIAFVANCGRAFFLVYIAATQGVPNVEHWHDIAGYAIVGLVFLGCLGLTKLFKSPKSEVRGQRSEVRAQESNVGVNQPSTINQQTSPSSFVIRPSPFGISSTAAAAALIYFLLVEAAVEGWYRSHERNLVRTAQWNVRWPEKAPDFRETKMDDRTRNILRFDEGRGASWRATDRTSDYLALLFFFRWHPNHNSALLANAHRPDVCLPASGWKQTGDYGVREYEVTPGLSIPFRHFEFGYQGPGRPRSAHAFYVVWEDRVNEEQQRTGGTSMRTDPSAWTRRERIDAVLQGRRHLGQQVMEYLIMQPRPVSSAEAQELFASEVRKLIVPGTPST